MTTDSHSGDVRTGHDDPTAVYRPAAAEQYPEDRTSFTDRFPYSEEPVFSEERQHRRYGGFSWGADLFGWLTTLTLGFLLSGVLVAVVTALGWTADLAGSGGTGLTTPVLGTAGLALFVVLISYYSGGYVAGRMCRFDGGRQGAGVWLIGLLMTGAAVGLALLLGPQVAVPQRFAPAAASLQAQGVVGVVAGAVVALLALLASMAGGRVGRRYHAKVDEAGYL